MQNATLVKIGLSAVVITGAGGFLIYESTSSAQHYYKVDKLMDQKLDQFGQTELKVHGWVVAGSITEAVVDQETQRSFVLQSNGKKIRVFNKGPIPDTFKDQSEVVASGHLLPASHFETLAKQLCAPHDGKVANACPIRIDAEQAWIVDSTELMAKCPSKYSGAPNLKLDPQYK
jgi:cytochrome c-type biogenesis protein CcmE